MRWQIFHSLMPGFVMLIGACAAHPPEQQRPLLTLPAERRADVETVQRPGASEQVVATALRMIGTPYRYGGRSPNGFDCSGLVHYAYAAAAIDVPRTSRAQLAAARRISLQQARRGDLLFFQSVNLSHVAIYLGGGEFVHAPSSGKRVERGSLDLPYYRQRLVAVGRLLPPRE